LLESSAPLFAAEVPFRSEVQFSNFMSAEAALVLEKAAGQPWETLMQDLLLGPLRMNNAFLSSRAASSTGRRASPLYWNGVVDVELDPAFNDNTDFIAPSSAISTSAVDMAKWMNFQFGNFPDVLRPATLRTMQTAQSRVSHR
jgi:CubicO group peptidase (beta-lactamase class C family)